MDGARKEKQRVLRPEPALAVLFNRYGGVEKAFDVLLRSTRENPRDPVMWSDLGNAYRVKGESELAVECFERALRAHISGPAKREASARSPQHARGDLEETTRRV